MQLIYLAQKNVKAVEAEKKVQKVTVLYLKHSIKAAGKLKEK